MRKLKFLVLIAVLFSFVGCATVKGAASGFAQDCKSLTNSVPNVWDALVKADKRFQEVAW